MLPDADVSGQIGYYRDAWIIFSSAQTADIMEKFEHGYAGWTSYNICHISAEMRRQTDSYVKM